MSALDHFDVAIIGAGIIGLAIAQRVSEARFMANRSIVLLDQESSFGKHISSRNSEVIHAGLYYPDKSLKARLCVRGKELLYDHCRKYNVAHRRLGKLIVAGPAETGQLERLRNQGSSNGVDDLVMLDRQQLKSREHAVEGAAALFSPSSGIIDAHDYMLSLLRLAELRGVIFAPNTQVLTVESESDFFTVDTRLVNESDQHNYRLHCSVLINCAGLEATNLARQIDGINEAAIPALSLCKGDYFSYQGANPFTHLIYPVPESNTVGLGIHASLDMAGRLRFGPDTRYLDEVDYQVDPHKAEAFNQAIRRYFPAIDGSKLSPDYAGIRPKLSGPDQPPADFMIQQADQHGLPGLVQLFGIESPGLTASLAIADLVRDSIRDYL